MTRDGSRLAEEKRAELAAIAGLKPKQVSDGDLFEYLARGEKATKQYLADRT